MVEFKILRITDVGGAISVVVQIPSLGKIVPISYNPAAFKVMTPEEVEYSVADMINQMFGDANIQTMIGESKIVSLSKHFRLHDESRPMMDSNNINRSKKEVDPPDTSIQPIVKPDTE
jgi:hypothetical protein